MRSSNLHRRRHQVCGTLVCSITGASCCLNTHRGHRTVEAEAGAVTGIHCCNSSKTMLLQSSQTHVDTRKLTPR